MGADESDAGGEGGADTRRLSRLSIHAVVQAFDNVYGGDLSATRSYAKASVRFSAVFEDMIGMANGQMQISWDHFNTTIPLEVLEQRNAQGKEKRRQALLQGQRASGQDGGKGGKAIAVKVGPHPLTLTSHHSPLTTHLLPQALMWLFRIYTQLEVSMNDVERVEEYTHELPTEDYNGTEADPTLLLRARFGAPMASWPTEGAVEFCDVRLQYASAHRPIFDGLSFKVAPRTRVGVVGRTGAGKSSLTVALFR